MTGTEIYKRTPAFEVASAGIRLHAPHWKLLLAYDGQRSLAEVALSQEVAFAEALPLTERFLSEGWIEEQPITLDQYLKRTGAGESSATGAAIASPVVLHAGHAPNVIATPPANTAPPTVKPPPPPLPSRPIEAPMPSTANTIPARVPAAPVAPVRSATPAQETPQRTIKVKTLVDYIVTQVGNSSLGQLMVYRILLRVPPQLLQDEDIASVHLVNDSSVMKTEALVRGIEDAVMEVLRRPLPDSVYSPA